MKLLIVTNLYPPDVLGGYELLAQDVVDELRSRGHSVSVLTSGRGQAVEGVQRILHLSRSFGSEARKDRARHLIVAVHNATALRHHLHREGVPDAALVMSLRRLGVEPLRVLREFAVPYVLTVNDDWPVAFASGNGPGIRGRIGSLLDRAPWSKHMWRGLAVDRVLYLSACTRDLVRTAVPWFPPGLVRWQGVNHKLFSPRPFRRIPSQPELLFAGRLHPTKAPEVALETLAALRSLGIRGRLTFAGAPVSAPYQVELSHRSVALGVADDVRWLGLVPRDQLADVYRGSDVVLFLSRWAEPQGLTYMEAIACGVNVVAYPLGGAKELLDACPVVARAPSCTGPAVARVIADLMRDPIRQERLVADGLQLVTRRLSLDAYVDDLVVLLRNACLPERGA